MLTIGVRRLLCAAALTAVVATTVAAVRTSRLTLGVQPNGSVIVPTNQVLTPVGLVRRLEHNRAKDLSLSPDGQRIAVLGHQRVYVFGADGTEIASAACSSAPLGIVWAPSSTAFYTSERSGSVARFTLADPHHLQMTEIPVEKLAAERAGSTSPADPLTTGLAVSPDGHRLYAALGIRNAVAVIDLATEKLTQLVPVGVCPYRIALSADGKTLYVANRGGRRVTESAGTALSAGTPVRIDRRTDAALRGSVSIVDTASYTVNEVEVGRQPSGLAVAPSGDTVYVSNADDDTVSVLNTRTSRVTRTIPLRPAGDPGFGQMPSALALSANSERLFVTCGGANAVAVVGLREKPRILGFIPAGWFPIAIAERNGRLFVANSKGVGARPEHPARGYRVHDSVGTVQFVAPTDYATLGRLTKQVASNNRWGAEPHARTGIAAIPVPERVGEPSVFKHVVYIIKENHTYDTNFGDMPEGNGDPSLCLFGEQVTPNQHVLARQFVLLDNTYTSGTNSAEGHQWTDSALANDYMETNYDVEPRSYPRDGGDPLALSPAGFLWTAAARRNLSVRVYGEFANMPKIVDTTTSTAANDGILQRILDRNRKSKPQASRSISWTELWRDYKSGGHRFEITAHTSNATIRRFLHPRFIGMPQTVSDQWRADQYLAELAEFEHKGTMPALSIMLLPNDHTSGTTPGMPTPRAAVADNDLALGRIVDAITHSRFWRDTLILVVEDDGQLGLDHVDGHRAPALCISPYTRRGAVVSAMYNHTSLIRTIELVLGIPALNRFDRTATPMSACFTRAADLQPYTSRLNRIALDEMNPSAHALRGVARRLALASQRQDWSQVDRANPTVVAKSVWLATKPGIPFPTSKFHPTVDKDD